MLKEIDRFKAKSASGKEYLIIVTQKFIDASTADDPNAIIPGLKSAKTADGRFLNFIDENTFKLVDTGEILTRI